ncbi:helix-turn-helix domain-containing protein [soil metagenome]
MTAGLHQVSAYREYPPPPDLSSHIACTWVRRDGEKSPDNVPIIPDGCADIVVFEHEAPRIAGPAIAPRIVPIEPEASIVGLRFRPGAARALFGCSAVAILDCDISLADVCQAPQDMPRTSGAARAALEAWARHRLSADDGRDLHLIAAAAMFLNGSSYGLDRLVGELGWNHRRLHREFTATCGYGPKMLARIFRLQNTLGLARRTPAIAGLAHLAAAAGYADQAHMTRDFRALTSMTPAQYLTAGNLEVGRWTEF